jgi:hypothetical protein
LRDSTRRRIAIDHPVATARHFAHRWRAFKKWLLSDSAAIGRVADLFYRVEFQRRGSTHIHAMLWVSDSPNLDTVEGLQQAPEYIDRFINATDIPRNDLPARFRQHAIAIQEALEGTRWKGLTQPDSCSPGSA